ncbi:MAG: hypothetical protein CMK59_07840 [Proteobacteria bacterium]|nr:hypothetical protein [Pseudomonadota bacterium]
MIRGVLLLVFLLLPSLAFATKRVAVLEFRGVGIDSNALPVITDYVRSGVLEEIGNQQIDDQDILVMTRENMRDMLTQMGKSILDCEGECEVETARSIGADYVVSGEVTQLGDLFVLNIKFHETTRGQLLAMEATRDDDLEDILDEAKESGAKVVRKGLELRSRASVSDKASTFVGGQFGYGEEDRNADWLVDQGRAEVSVLFKSVPQGATVYVDGRFICSETPCQKYVSEGNHEVRFNLQRYTDEIEHVNVKKGTVVTGSMTPLFGTVHIVSEPSGIQMYSSDQNWGRTPLTKEIDPGIYTLQIKDPCFETSGYRFQMKQGGRQDISLSLTHKQSAVKVYAYEHDNAVDGLVFVDGKRVGTTAESVAVPLCSKKVEVRTADGKMWSGDLSLKEKQLSTIEAYLSGKEEVNEVYSFQPPVVQPLPMKKKKVNISLIRNTTSVIIGGVALASYAQAYQSYRLFFETSDRNSAEELYRYNRMMVVCGLVLSGSSILIWD